MNRSSIHNRAEIVGTRKRYGAWEIDTVIGKRGTGIILTTVERKVASMICARFLAKMQMKIQKSY